MLLLQKKTWVSMALNLLLGNVNSTSSSTCVMKYNDLTHRAECKGVWAPPSVNELDSHSEGPSQFPFNPGHKGMPFSNGTDGLWKRPNLDGTDRKRGHKG